MRAVRYRRGTQGVRCEDVPAPEAAVGEVLVRVEAAGLCGTDVSIAYGAGDRMVSQDVLTLGHETAGTIAAVGPGVSGWQPGDRVVASPIITCGHCRYCDRGASENCNAATVFGLGRDGALAEYVTAPAGALVRLPSGVPAEIGALVTDAVATPYHALLERARLVPGESVAIFGVGGLGQHAIQLARLAGASPIIAVDVRADQLDLARRLGADRTVDATAGDVAAAVRRANGGRGVDVAGEFIGRAATIEAAFASLTKGGRAVVVGLGDEPITLPPSGSFAMRQMSLMGSGGFSKNTIERLLELVASGRLDLGSSVSHRVALEDVDAALRMLRDKSEPVRRVVALP
ncbi:zinc-dependent alcohol dehydrogenase [Dactylosporangium sp. CA-233914]|uniref:zinc-dependent alcohol dehydrogenase n=1 Tax=Dactylosporangium sp. CA-233914 TaxID=3239934 RepID=UPI003D8F6188